MREGRCFDKQIPFFFLEELSLIKIFQFFSEGCQQRSKEKLYLKTSLRYLSISPSIRCSKLLRSMQLSLAHKNKHKHKNKQTNIYIYLHTLYTFICTYMCIYLLYEYMCFHLRVLKSNLF